MSKKKNSEARVRIEKQSKMSKIAAPTLNPRWKTRTHKFQDKKFLKNSTLIQDKIINTIFNINMSGKGRKQVKNWISETRVGIEKQS